MKKIEKNNCCKLLGKIPFKMPNTAIKRRPFHFTIHPKQTEIKRSKHGIPQDVKILGIYKKNGILIDYECKEETSLEVTNYYNINLDEVSSINNLEEFYIRTKDGIYLHLEKKKKNATEFEIFEKTERKNHKLTSTKKYTNHEILSANDHVGCNKNLQAGMNACFAQFMQSEEK